MQTYIHLRNPKRTECLSATAAERAAVGDAAIPLHTYKIKFSFRIHAAKDMSFFKCNSYINYFLQKGHI